MDKLTLIAIKTVSIRIVITTQHRPGRSVTSRRVGMIHHGKIDVFSLLKHGK